MGLLCRPLQCDSGLLRLPLPGEAGLEILYQPQRTWFPNHPKSGFVLFFPLLFLSFFFFLPGRLPLSGRFSSSTLHIPALLPQLSLPRSMPAASHPAQESLAELQGRMWWHTRGQSWPAQHCGSRGTACGTSHLHIPKSHPCPPDRAGACSQASLQSQLPASFNFSSQWQGRSF